MSTSLAELSVKRPVFAWMLMSFLIIFGAISFSRMGVSELPDVDFPVLTVSVNLEGAAPEVVELDVVDILEDAVMTVEGVQSVSSSSRQGSASIVIQFDLDRDINTALQDVQARIAQAQRRLPKDMDPPVIFKANPEDQPILWLSVESKTGDVRALADYVRTNLKDQFGRLPGVAEVFLGGFVDPNIRVDLERKKLDQYALTFKDVLSAIQTEHKETPAGQFSEGGKEFSVRGLGEAKTLNDLKALALTTRGGQPNFTPLSLSQVASVERGMNEVRRMSRTNGNPSIGLGIRKQRGSNAVAVAKEIRAKLAEVSSTLPPEYQIGVNFDGTTFIQNSVRGLNLKLLAAAILTSLVCLLFLGSWASTFNVILSIPTSIVGTFIVLYFSNFTLNTFTLLGLTISIGIVVDDAIMVLENITRHFEMGKTKVQAAIDGAREISFAAVAATISIIAIFLPVIFMDGIVGKFLYQFGITISVAVMLSLVEALTITPMRCSQLMPKQAHRSSRWGMSLDRFFNTLNTTYEKGVDWSVQNRWKVVLMSLGFMALTVIPMRLVEKEFAPAQDQSRFMIRVKTPTGSSIEFTNEKMKVLEDFLMKRPELSRYYAAVGGFGGGEVNTGMLFVSLNPKGSRGIDPEKGRELSQQEFMNLSREFFKTIPDVEAFAQDLSARGFAGSGRGFPVEFTIRGPEWKTLQSLADQIKKDLSSSGKVVDVDSNLNAGAPEVQIVPDRAAANLRGVSITAIGETVAALTNGVIAGKFPEGGRRYDIRLQVKDSEQKDAREAIKNLFVRNNRGELVSLSQVVKMESAETMSVINREDRERALSVFANVAPGVSQEVAIAEAESIAKANLPEGYRLVMSGSSKSLKEGFQSLFVALILGILVAYMVLGSQFNSFVHPLTVLTALPFSITGAFISLWVTGLSLNLYSFIGILLLMGIVKKNSILMVDYTNQLRRDEKLSVAEALRRACPVRLRPILMTSIATMVGALPGALPFGEGYESRMPLSVAVIGGVALSTILTLFVVPAVYSLLSGLELKNQDDTSVQGRHSLKPVQGTHVG